MQISRRRCRKAVGTMIVCILMIVSACGTDTTPPTSPPATKSAPPATPPVASLPQGGQLIPVAYQSRARRDPFRQPTVKTAQQPATVHLTLTGIVREAHSYYALVESDSPPGIGYIIRENDVVDSAKVVRITKDSVVFAVQIKNPEGKLLTRYVEKHM